MNTTHNSVAKHDRRLVLLLVEDTKDNKDSHFVMLNDFGFIHIEEGFRPSNDMARILTGMRYSGIEVVICETYLEAHRWIREGHVCQMALLDCKLDVAQHEPLDKQVAQVAGIFLWKDLLTRSSRWPVHSTVQSIVYSSHPDLALWYLPFNELTNLSPLQVIVKAGDSITARNDFREDLHEALTWRMKILQNSFVQNLDTRTLRELDKEFENIKYGARNRFLVAEKLMNRSLTVSNEMGWTLKAIFPVQYHLYYCHGSKKLEALEAIHEFIAQELKHRSNLRLTIEVKSRRIIIHKGDKSVVKPFPNKAHKQATAKRDAFHIVCEAAKRMRDDTKNGLSPSSVGFIQLHDLQDDEGNFYYPREKYYAGHLEFANRLSEINVATRKRFPDDWYSKPTDNSPVEPFCLLESRGSGYAQWRLTIQDVSIEEDL